MNFPQRISKRGFIDLKAFLRVPYLRNLNRNGNLSIKCDSQVHVISTTFGGDKYAIEFPYDIWTDTDHDFNNGCNGKGTVNRCLYIPCEYVAIDEISDDDIEIIACLL